MFMLYPICVYFWSIWPITSTMFYFYHVHCMRDIPRVIHNICGHLCNAKAHLNAHCGNLRSALFKYASISALLLFLAHYLSLGNEIFTTSRSVIYNIFGHSHLRPHSPLRTVFISSAHFGNFPHFIYHIHENVHKTSQLLLFHLNYLFECI